MEEPLLFIPTPPFYYIELDKEETQQFFEESTSVYEISRSEKTNSVIAKQLYYFCQPVRKKSGRVLVLNLRNNEKVIGVIEEFDGYQVKMKVNENVEVINGTDIVSISTKY
ncbi:4-diphosphocytidyl-2C-methyl-D-erythritol kinase [Ureibacillus sp. 179-F W5.1 NHS]|uniref:4-diphosphocytidyl-2C-methyl-D-erythritol kinase n=1 Tax=Lysinibacillus halotolerans TaxID=1368476 RepID=A0A3M8HDZ6_9BACI|nr:4-diphosphocytidyl-2C-methyl-D-erythritol kinase [Lysinibacillus halotolerans]RND00603.1 4-diphosphocytidyl-2C-methyl-D-erythritol kinase [Lysinibacillus halotolerans]